MPLQKIPLLLSIAILAVVGIVVTLVAAQSGTTINTTPHVISNVTVTDITQSTATIRWQTEEPASSTVYFYVNGTMVDLASQYLDRTTTHAVTIYGRLPGTTYHYRVMSGNTDVYFDPTAPSRKAISDSPDQVFTTLPSSSSTFSAPASSMTTPHVISNVTVTDITQTTATIRWQTEEPATSRVDFYINNTFVDFFYKWDDHTTTHSMTIHGRLPGTTYHYRVGSGDPGLYENLSRTAISDSPDQVFTTLASSSPTLAPSSPLPTTASQAIIVPDSLPSQLTAPSVSTPTASPSPPTTPPVVPNIQPIAAPPVIRPAPSPNLSIVQTGSTVQKAMKKISPKEFKKEQLAFRRELRKFERVLLRQGKTAALDQVADLREELYDLDPDDTSAGDDLSILREEFAELRLIVETATPAQQGKPAAIPVRKEIAAPVPAKSVVTQKAPASPTFSPETSIAITYPPEGSTLRGFANIDVALQNASEASGFQFQVDGKNIGGDENGKPPYGKTWFTKNVANGAHELRVMAWDSKGNTVTSNPVRVIVENVPDTIPPTMSMPKVTAVTRTTATIQWTTDEPVGTDINYKEDLGSGYGRNYGAIRNFRERKTQHEVTLTGLTPGTKYSYYVSASDDAGNSPVREKYMGGYEGTYALRYRQFTTLSNSPLVIFNFHIKDVTQTSATIAWTTSVPANAELKWSDSVPPVRHTTLTTEHTFTLTNLKPFTLYTFRIRSEDALGNTVQIPPPDVDYRGTFFQTQEIPNEAPETKTRVHRPARDMDSPYYSPGGQAYFDVTVKDDRPLQMVKVWLMHKRNIIWEIVLPQCSGKTSCEIINYPFTIPEEPGKYYMEFGVQEMPLSPPAPGAMHSGASHNFTVAP